MRTWLRRLSACLLVALPFAPPAAAFSIDSESPDRSLPLVFVENRGQSPADVLFEAYAAGFRARFTAAGFEILETDGSGTRAAWHFEGARDEVRVRGYGETMGRVHRLVGAPRDWVHDAPAWTGVIYEGVYEGIDVVLYRRGGRIEYDVRVHPGGRVGDFVVRCEGEGTLGIDESGALVSDGALRHAAPESWQVETDGSRTPLESAFRLLDDSRFAFTVEGRDRALELVIDPVLIHDTHVGGSGADTACGVAVDSAGYLYVTGWTRSSDFPLGEDAIDDDRSGRDAFVFKLDPAGRELVWATFLGGSGDERGRAIRVNLAGEAYVVGETYSDDFPATDRAYSQTRKGGADIFLASLSADGTALRFATFVGGSGEDTPYSLDLGAAGHAYVAGTTRSADFPVTPHAFQRERKGACDGFVAKIDAHGTIVHYATYLGGLRDDHAAAVTVDPAGHAFVGGRTASVDFPTTVGAYDETRHDIDGFVAKLSVDGGSLIFATYLGGSRPDEVTSIAHGVDQTLWVGGITRSSDFPVTLSDVVGGRQDGFVTGLSVSGGALLVSTRIGGSGTDACRGLAVDSGGSVWVAGDSDSDDFLMPAPSPQSSRAGGTDGFALRLDGSSGAVTYGTFLGGAGDEQLLAVQVNEFTGDVAFAGDAAGISSTRRGALGGRTAATDAFVARIAPGVCGRQAELAVIAEGAGATLGSTRPILGRELVLSVSGAPPGAEGVLMVGRMARQPVIFDGLGDWMLEPTSSSVLTPFAADTEGCFVLRIKLPERTGLCGYRCAIQGAIFGPGGTTPVNALTEAYLYTLGD